MLLGICRAAEILFAAFPRSVACSNPASELCVLLVGLVVVLMSAVRPSIKRCASS